MKFITAIAAAAVCFLTFFSASNLAEADVKEFGKNRESAAQEALLDKYLLFAGESAHKVATALHQIADGDFFSASLTSFLLIVVSEIGDKTFFIAALLAMKRGIWVTFLGAAAALVVMTGLSALAGKALPTLVDPKWTHIASVSLFLFFGIKLLWEAWNLENGAADLTTEMGEVEADLRNLDSKRDEETTFDVEDRHFEKTKGQTLRTRYATLWMRLFQGNYPSATAFAEAFALTFAAEWGDRSQIATLALGASKNIYGVNFGAIMGHLLCTAIAVIGGQMLASRISVRTVLLVGGATFMLFAMVGYLMEA